MQINYYYYYCYHTYDAYVDILLEKDIFVFISVTLWVYRCSSSYLEKYLMHSVQAIGTVE